MASFSLSIRVLVLGSHFHPKAYYVRLICPESYQNMYGKSASLMLYALGIVGSVLAKEGHLSNVSNLVSGALKIFSNPFKQVESHSSASKPHNDFLIAEVCI
ncbi:hypothetical protein Patl1_16972 [Pistacia atlantica]|uniref:Uncharacterized protein n=1 Tax=Pistacia atlantica TaxID=434234 RepID=A0ACC1B874_9ROSI|nr:hypothetical protein Patl1_16972 [Pistacia atlantica]